MYNREQWVQVEEGTSVLLWDSKTGKMQTAVSISGWWFDSDGKSEQESIHSEFDFYRPLPKSPQQILNEYND